MTQLSQDVARQVLASNLLSGPSAHTSGGLPSNLSTDSALSAAVMTSLSGSGYFNEVDLMGDLDGKEDLTADHSAKVNDFSSMPVGWSLTRTAINVYVASRAITISLPLTTTVLNLPTLFNAFGNLNSDDQVVITGLAVNPVSDLTAFANVNGSFSGFNGKIGELLLVTFWDTGGGLRLISNNQIVRSGVNQLLPSFSMLKRVITTTVEIGVPFSYTLSIVNSSTPATGVSISETLPISTTFVSASQGGVQTGSGIRWTGFDVPQFGFLDVNWTLVPGCDTTGKTIIDNSTFVTSTQNLAPTYANSVTVHGVNQGILPDFSYNDLGNHIIQFTNLSQRATNYLWDFGDGATSVLADPIHTFKSGTFNVKLTASNLCNSSETTQSLVLAPGPVFIPLALR